MVVRTDLHVHPLLNTFLFRRDPGKQHQRPPFFFPLFNYTDYPRAYAAKVRLLFSVIYVLPFPWKSTMEEVSRLTRLAMEQAKHAEVPVRVVRTAQEMRNAVNEGSLALVHVVEGGHVIGGDETNVDRLAELGIRYITLVHFVHNRIGGAAAVPFGGRRGLSDFGRRVVRRMYKRGIVADLSHATVPTFWDTLKEATGPVIATHSGARAFALHDRNLNVDQAKAIAQSGGVVGVILCPFYLNAWHLRGSLDDLVRNVSYFVNLIGAEHVTIGSDLDGWLWPVHEIRDISDHGLIPDALERSGMSRSDVDLVVGESLVRMFERIDAKMQNAK